MLFANTDAKHTAFQTVLAEATKAGGTTKSPCENAADWVTYTESQVKFYGDLVKAPALLASVALVVAIALVIFGQNGAAIGAGVASLLGAGGTFAILKGLAADAEKRRVEATAARDAACKQPLAP